MPAAPPLAVEPLARQHDRASFSCGEPALDDYFRRRARQDHERNVARVFVAFAGAPPAIAGYYTLSTLAIDPGALPPEVARKLPRYPELPAALIGRLARDMRFRGQGVGEFLLLDAMARIIDANRQVAVYAIVVDAKNDAAGAFYRSFGFVPFPSRPSRLFLPTATAAEAFGLLAR